MSLSVWESKISASSVATSSNKLQYLSTDSKGNLYYQLRNPLEKGRSTIVKNGKDLLPKEISIGTKAHEYGGISYLIFEDKVIFSNAKDQGLYLIEEGNIVPIIQNKNMRYADGDYDSKRGNFYYIREDKENEKSSLVLIDPISRTEKVLLEDHDFFASPRVSKDGKMLAFIAWDHPNMPWDSSLLYLYKIDDSGALIDGKKIAGSKNSSALEPRWGEEGVLFFIDDRTGFWNIYSFKDENIEPINEVEAEFGYPPWVFGIKTYGVTDKNAVVATYIKEQKHLLGIYRENKFEEIPTDYDSFDDLLVINNTLYFIGGSSYKPSELVKMNLNTYQKEVILTIGTPLNEEYVSLPESMIFPGKDGEKVYGYFYFPKNPHHKAEKPPVIVRAHGGPTAKAMPMLNAEVQYWTSRGFAVADVNYRGSSGFGRAYREKLDKKWGIIDVEDCISFVDYLSTQGRIDFKRAIIKGRSSGGFTALSALIYSDVFAVGSVSYGIGNLEGMACDTHRFEKHYCDRLIASYPENRDEYVNRSPITYPEKLKTPLVLFHGKKDKVVPIEQSNQIHQILLRNKIPVTYVTFDDEGHGFRSAETICKTLQIELCFFAKILELTFNEKVEPITIENFKESI